MKIHGCIIFMIEGSVVSLDVEDVNSDEPSVMDNFIFGPQCLRDNPVLEQQILKLIGQGREQGAIAIPDWDL